MNRIHSTLIALVIGAAATAGLYAALHTVRLGQKAAQPTVSARALAARQAKLTAWGRALDTALAKRPPALPKLPHFSPVQAPAPSVAQPHVTYVQAPPVVKYEHAPPRATTTTTSSSSDDESDDDGSSDDSGDDTSGDDD